MILHFDSYSGFRLEAFDLFGQFPCDGIYTWNMRLVSCVSIQIPYHSHTALQTVIIDHRNFFWQFHILQGCPKGYLHHIQFFDAHRFPV